MHPLSMDSIPAQKALDSTRTPAILSGRCRLSVLFCDLCDSTALSGRVEAEEYGDVLASLRRLYESVVAHHGGTVVRLQGDGMLAIFGFPQPREGDGRRAVEAALQLHRGAADLRAPGPAGREQRLQLHSGKTLPALPVPLSQHLTDTRPSGYPALGQHRADDPALWKRG